MQASIKVNLGYSVIDYHLVTTISTLRLIAEIKVISRWSSAYQLSVMPSLCILHFLIDSFLLNVLDSFGRSLSINKNILIAANGLFVTAKLLWK